MDFGLAQDLEKQLNQRKEDKDASAKKDANVNKDANMNKDANVTKDADVNKDANVTKDANVQAVDPPNNLKEQLQELKSHHTIAVDLFVCLQYRSSIASRFYIFKLFQQICQFFKQ